MDHDEIGIVGDDARGREAFRCLYVFEEGVLGSVSQGCG